MTSDGIFRIFACSEEDSIRLKKHSEFSVVNYLERQSLMDLKCPSCNSANLQFFDTIVDDYPNYDFDRIARYCDVESELMFMITITKENNNITFESNGNYYVDRTSLLNFLKIF
jgi:hypothetical protein